jgi:hypothetical protein
VDVSHGTDRRGVSAEERVPIGLEVSPREPEEHVGVLSRVFSRSPAMGPVVAVPSMVQVDLVSASIQVLGPETLKVSVWPWMRASNATAASPSRDS